MKSKIQADSVLWEWYTSAQKIVFSPCCHLVEGVKEPCGTSFKRIGILFMRANPSRPNRFPKAILSNIITLWTGFQQMNLGWGGMQTETFSPSQMDWSTISEAKRRNTWNSGRNNSKWPENVVLGSINHKSFQGSSRVVWNVKSESWGLPLQMQRNSKRVHQTSSVQTSGC